MVTERVLIKLFANAPLVLFDDSLHVTASLSSRTVSTDGFRGALRWLHLLSYHQQECYTTTVYVLFRSPTDANFCNEAEFHFIISAWPKLAYGTTVKQ